VSPDASKWTTVDGRELAVSNLDKCSTPPPASPRRRSSSTTPAWRRSCWRTSTTARDHEALSQRVEGKYFFEKHIPDHAPEWIRHVEVPSTSDGPPVDYLLIDDRPAWCGPRTWPPSSATSPVACREEEGAPGPSRSHGVRPRSRRGHIDRRVLPGGRAGAEQLEEDGSAGRRPADPRASSSTSRCPVARPGPRAGPGHGVAVALERDHPDLVVSNMRKSLRRHKVLIDGARTTRQDHDRRLLTAGRPSDRLHAGDLGRSRPLRLVGGARRSGLPPDAVLDRIEAHGDLFAEV